MNKLLMLALLFLATGIPSIAQKLSGKVTDQQGGRLPFASLQIKGKPGGGTANADGNYQLRLQPGTYTIVCQHVGYQQQEKSVTIGQEDVVLNFELPIQQLTLGEAVVRKGEDPAYAIMRQAIKKRPVHRNELRSFTTEVYTKGQFRLRDHPKKFMGEKVDFEDGDTSKRKILYLSETVARYSVQPPDKRKVEVIATKVSGQTDGFGLSAPRIFTLYENLVTMGSGLSSRGFISPLSDNALNFYRFKYEGAFTENGRMINQIRVIPKRRFEPLFQGYINIVEDEWRIHSLDLMLLKDYGLQTFDTLKLQQLYTPLNGGAWVLRNQVLYPTLKFLGFDGFGNFVNVYSDYNLNPAFRKGYFDNTVLRYTDSSNKKPSDYWNENRPVALQEDEVADYRKKDSMEQVRKSPRYLDSVDRVRNKFSTMGFLLTGQSFSKEKKRSSISVPPLIGVLSYNTVEGAVVNAQATYRRALDTLSMNRRSFSITPEIRYGFSNGHINPNLTINYRFNNRRFRNLTLSGGSDVFQFDNENPISELFNTFSTLMSRRNPLKIYEARYFRFDYAQGLDDGFSVSGRIQFQDRIPLENTTDYNWASSKRSSQFTPNYPVEVSNTNITRHQAFLVGMNLRWQPGTRYVEFPNARISIGSKYPLFTAGYTHALPGVLGSDVSYGRWSFNVAHSLNLRLGGRTVYRFELGGLVRRDSLQLPDLTHFRGNPFTFSQAFDGRFQLVSPYFLSNASRFYSHLFFEHHFNGLITNKIPGIRKLKWNLVAGTNALFFAPRRHYIETFVGLENIFRIFRVDFIYGMEDNGRTRQGFPRLGFSSALFGR